MSARFQNRTIHKEIDLAIKDAERLLAFDSPMMRDIRKKTDFQYDCGTGLEVAGNLLIPRATVPVFTYRPKYSGTSAVGNYDKGTISVNIYAIPELDHDEWVAWLLHELGHHHGFHHIDPGWWGYVRRNYQTDNKNKFSLPYFITVNTKRWLEEMKTEQAVQGVSYGGVAASPPLFT